MKLSLGELIYKDDYEAVHKRLPGITPKTMRYCRGEFNPDSPIWHLTRVDEETITYSLLPQI